MVCASCQKGGRGHEACREWKRQLLLVPKPLDALARAGGQWCDCQHHGYIQELRVTQPGGQAVTPAPAKR